jgi:hypothetical protein
METNVKIMMTVVDKLQERWDTSDAAHYTTDEEEKERTIDALRQDIKYSIDMLTTIIDIEVGDKEKGGVNLS